MTTMKIETYLPLFNGFYNSTEDSFIDSTFEGEIRYYQEEHKLTDAQYKDLYNELIDFIPFKESHDLIARSAVDVFNKAIERVVGIKDCITFESIWSPQYYNYNTDVIHCSISEKSFNELKTLFGKDVIEPDAKSAAELIKQAFEEDAGSYADEAYILELQEVTSEKLSDLIGSAIYDKAMELINKMKG